MFRFLAVLGMLAVLGCAIWVSWFTKEGMPLTISLLAFAWGLFNTIAVTDLAKSVHRHKIKLTDRKGRRIGGPGN